MVFILSALGIYWVTGVCRTYLVIAPAIVWHVVVLILAVGATYLYSPDEMWYLAPSIAGASALLQRVDDFLSVKADEAVKNNLRR